MNDSLQSVFYHASGIRMSDLNLAIRTSLAGSVLLWGVWMVTLLAKTFSDPSTEFDFMQFVGCLLRVCVVLMSVLLLVSVS